MNNPKRLSRTAIKRFAVLGCLLVCMAGHPAHGDENGEKYFQAGVNFLQNSDYEQAVENLKKAAELIPDNPLLFNALGVSYLNLQQYPDETIEAFNRAIKLYPSYSEAYSNLGTAYASLLHDIDLAEKNFQKAIEISPEFPRPYLGLAWIQLMERQDSRKAQELFEKVIAMAPNYPEAYYGLGMAYIAQGNRAMALKPISSLRRFKRDDLAQRLEALIQDRAKPFVDEDLKATESEESGQPSTKKPQKQLNLDEYLSQF